MPFNRNKSMFFDLELRCGDQVYRVNKAQLAQNSPVLEAMLQNWTEGDADLGKIFKEDAWCLTPQIVNMFLDYCYEPDAERALQKLVLDANTVIKFLKVCHSLLVFDVDEKLLDTVKAAIDACDCFDVDIAVQLLHDSTGLGPWDQRTNFMSTLDMNCSVAIAQRLSLLEEERVNMLQGNCALLRMVLPMAPPSQVITRLIAGHLRCGCVNPERCLLKLSEVIVCNARSFTDEDAATVFKIGIIQEPKCREAALSLRAVKFKTMDIVKLHQDLVDIFHGDACQVLCELLDRADLAVESEDDVFYEICKLQAVLPRADMVQIWKRCRFAYLSPKCLFEMQSLLELVKTQTDGFLSLYFGISNMWTRVCQDKGDAALEKFLRQNGVSEHPWKMRLSPRSCYDKEVHVCEYRADDPGCPGIFRALGTKFGTTSYASPAKDQVHILVSCNYNDAPIDVLLEADPSIPLVIHHEDLPSWGTTWFKIDLGPRMRLKPSHCRFQVRNYDGQPVFEVKRDGTANSNWLGNELQPQWTPQPLTGGWRSMTVSLGESIQACQLMQVVFYRDPQRSVVTRGLELYGTLEISKKKW
eukprot:Skav205047  [mRNA]  locus=scaffold2506:212802:214553:+ [translate_table: standard]